MNVTFGAYYTLIMAVLVLMLGKLMTRHIRFLRDFNIPEPVSGGLVVAAIIFMLHQTTGLALSFEGSLQSAFMLVFFSSIGLSANFAKLREGGSALFLFLGVIAVFIIMQNIVGVSLASVLGLDPLIGLVAGSITLVGGHGTAGAWGSVLENQYGLTGATTLGIACATFGLIIGGLVGGPLAKRLITRHQLAQPLTESEQLRADAPRTIAAQQGHHLAGIDHQIHAMQHMGFAIPGIESRNFQRRSTCLIHCSSDLKTGTNPSQKHQARAAPQRWCCPPQGKAA